MRVAGVKNYSGECLACHQLFYARDKSYKFCSIVCSGKLFKKGQKPWNKLDRIEKTCPSCGTKFSVRPSLVRVKCCSRSCGQRGKTSPMKGCQASQETREKQRLAKLGIRGPDHWNWRGGSGTERHLAMNRDEYKQWRRAVFVRDGFTCVFCGTNGALQADHIKPWAKYPNLRYDVDNGRTLCLPCHEQTDTFPVKLRRKVSVN